MHSKTSNFKLESLDAISDSQSQNSNHTPKFYYPSLMDFTYQNQEEIEQRPTLNNNYLSTPLIINSINNYKEFEKFGRETKVTTNDLKTIEKEILLLNKKRKKNIFNVDEPIEINDEIKNLKNNLIFKKKSFGRKKKSDQTKGEHNKYSDDNIRRKCKHLILNSIMEFINEKIKIIYNGNIGNNIFKKELLTLNKNPKADATIDYNKTFLNKTLGDIFSETISGRFTNYLPQHNKMVIEALLNEKDEDKRIYFKKLFSLTFLQCLKHIRESIFIEEIDGIKCFNQIKENLNEEKEYLDILNYYINNFEVIINNKKARKQKKKRNENNN